MYDCIRSRLPHVFNCMQVIQGKLDPSPYRTQISPFLKGRSILNNVPNSHKSLTSNSEKLYWISSQSLAVKYWLDIKEYRLAGLSARNR